MESDTTADGQTFWCKPGNNLLLTGQMVLALILTVVSFSVPFLSVLWLGWLVLVLLLFLLKEKRRCGITFLSTGVTIEPGRIAISYDSIQGLQLGGMTVGATQQFIPKKPLWILHDAGRFEFPEPFAQEHTDIYRALLAQVPEQATVAIAPVMTDYINRCAAEYGPEAVMLFQGRIRHPRPTRPLLRWGAALGIAGLTWILLPLMIEKFNKPGGNKHDGSFYAFGVIALILCSVLLIVAAYRRFSKPKLLSGHLAITPAGMALIHGRLQGEIEWSQISKIDFLRIRNSEGGGVLRLNVPGAAIDLPDCWNRPLPIIERVIRSYAHRVELPPGYTDTAGVPPWQPR